MRDESLMGGTYHGPSRSAGPTAREYRELQAEAALDRSPYDDLDPNEGREYDDCGDED
jgi:hypothetical protein